MLAILLFEDAVSVTGVMQLQMEYGTIIMNWDERMRYWPIV